MIDRRPLRGTARAALVLAAFASVLVLAGCGSDEKVEALTQDPLATADIEGLELVSEDTSEPSWLDIKKVYPTLHRVFRISAGTSRDEALDRVSALAERNGWDLRPPVPSGFSGDKQIEGHPVALMVSASRADDERRLSVLLRAT